MTLGRQFVEVAVNSGQKVETENDVEAPLAQADSNNASQPRRRSYLPMGALLFIIIGGLPMILLPSLRWRLTDRVNAIRAAVVRGETPPLLAKVGENSEPFPTDLERPVFPQPQMPRVFYGGPPGMIPTTPGMDSTVESPASRTSPADASVQSSGSSPQPEYRQGQAERSAYDILLQARPTMAKLVEGSDPTLRFAAWSAARAEQDTYWVRVTFSKSDGAEVVYVWRVITSSQEVAPLNFNARSLPNP